MTQHQILRRQRACTRYDPADSRLAYLHKHTPRLGYLLLGGGIIGAVVALASLLG